MKRKVYIKKDRETHMHTYIYTQRERERKGEGFLYPSISYWTLGVSSIP